MLFGYLFIIQSAASPFFSGWGNFLNRFSGGGNGIIQGDSAVFPLCWPFGYNGDPNAQCYPYGVKGSVDNMKAGPCLPPVMYGRIIPPCQGPFVKLTDINQEGYNNLGVGLLRN